MYRPEARPWDPLRVYQFRVGLLPQPLPQSDEKGQPVSVLEVDQLNFHRFSLEVQDGGRDRSSTAVAGQERTMDVQAAVGGKIPVEFYGRLGGMVPLPDEILGEIRRLCYEPVAPSANPRITWMERLDFHKN